jgi:Ribonucleotide reductase, small chain/SCP-2 sterol transfer family
MDIAPAHEHRPDPLDAVSYDDLYRRWEAGHWRATGIDFTRDAEQWADEFSDLERRAALWNYALFFWGEDAVTDGLSPYVDAAPLEEQKYLLATQQVDEARHAVFFNRFMREVAGVGGDRVAEGLGAVEPQLTWGFTKVFDRLADMADELRRDPSIPRLAAAVALYHVVIEATLAQPGQHFIARYLCDRDLLPGFRAGMEHVAADEQRHIGFGVKLLADLRRMDPEVPHAVADLLREVIPWTAAVLVPPGWDMRYLECFGFTIEDIGAEGAASLETRMRSAGMPLDELPGPPVFPVPGSPRERAERGHRMVRAGFLGEKTGPPSRRHEDMALLFELVAAGLDGAAASEPGTLQWDFGDAEPWHIVVANGATRAVQGRAARPRATLRASYEDFVDVIAGRRHPRGLLLRGRLRPRGDLRWLVDSRRMFPGSRPRRPSVPVAARLAPPLRSRRAT